MEPKWTAARPMPIFRRTFEINGKVQHAELRIAGLGQFELSLDGRPVGPRGLHQDWTNFSKTVTYQTYRRNVRSQSRDARDRRHAR